MSEFIVEPHPDNVLGRIDAGRNGVKRWGGSTHSSGIKVVRHRTEIDIEVFELDAPIVGESVFAAGADRPSDLHLRRGTGDDFVGISDSDGSGGRNISIGETTGCVNQESIGRREAQAPPQGAEAIDPLIHGVDKRNRGVTADKTRGVENTTLHATKRTAAGARIAAEAGD